MNLKILCFTLILVLVASLVLFFPKHAQEAQIDPMEGLQNAPQSTQIVNSMSVSGIKAIAMVKFGSDFAVLAPIIKCESHWSQLKPDGTVLRGTVNPQDVGLGQINEHYWLEKSQELGYDIYTIEGNLDMTKYIYDHNGTQPWSASKPCWGVDNV